MNIFLSSQRGNFFLPELKWERFVSPFSASPSSGRFLESAISGDGHVSIPESAAILEFRRPSASSGNNSQTHLLVDGMRVALAARDTRLIRSRRRRRGEHVCPPRE